MNWTAERRSRTAFFVLNALAALPLLLPGLTGPGTAAALIAAALGAYLTVYCPGGDTPACAGLPVLLTLDLWAFLSPRLPELPGGFSLPRLSALLWMGLAAAVIVLSYTLLRDQFWTRWLARTGAGAALIFALWDGSPRFPLALFLGGAVLWQTARDLAEHADPSVRKRNDTLSALVYFPVLFLICFERGYLGAALPRWYDLTRELCEAFLRGPWAAVPPTLALFAALAAWDRDRAALGLDVFVLVSCLEFILLLTAYAVGPFAHGWILLAAFWTLFLRSARQAAEGQRFLRLDPKAWLAVQFAVFLAAIVLVRRGLYGNLLVSAGAAAALYALSREEYRREGGPSRRAGSPSPWDDSPPRRDGGPRRKGGPLREGGLLGGLGYLFRREGTLFWMTLLLAVFAEAAAWICVRRLCGENLAALGTLATAAFLTMGLLGLRHGHPVPLRWRAAVCALAALGCLCLTVRHGVRAEAAFDGEGTVVLRVAAREGGGSVSAVSYQWKTWGGDRAEVSFTEDELELPVRGERLVIDAVDDRGVRTVSTFWTPWSFPED